MLKHNKMQTLNQIQKNIALKTKKIFNNKNKGFTLVELLVSTAIFSMVLVAIIGVIVTIMDVNKKSRTLSLVMNELNFTVESMNRSIKTGDVITNSGGTVSSLVVEDQNEDTITYFLQGGGIYKQTNTLDSSNKITSDEIIIEDLNFIVKHNDPNTQPLVIIAVRGYAEIGGRIKTDFNIQTAISQRKLNLD
jgi:prepilin-type N-terminal cleavage/methylation domain-containing protein